MITVNVFPIGESDDEVAIVTIGLSTLTLTLTLHLPNIVCAVLPLNPIIFPFL
jgi:hypothetical protein